MVVRAVRLEADRGAVMLLRLLELAEPSVKRDQVDVRLHLLGVNLERYFVFSDGLLNLSPLLEQGAAAYMSEGPPVEPADRVAQRVIHRRDRRLVLFREFEGLLGPRGVAEFSVEQGQRIMRGAGKREELTSLFKRLRGCPFI